jgi:hypothetical protein
MRYFKHPPLLFWTIAIVVAIAIAVIAALVGRTSGDHERGLPSQTAEVVALRAKLAQLPIISHDQPAMKGWALALAGDASTAAQNYARSGAVPNNQLERAYRKLAADADQLAGSTTGVAQTQAINSLYLDGDVLAALVSPLPGVGITDLPSTQ